MMDLAAMLVDDLALAEDLQVQEVLQFSTHFESVCAVCEQGIPSLEASWKPDSCDHVICIACFGQYAQDTGATGAPRCAVASCESLCMPETHQEISVGDGSLISRSGMDIWKGKEPLNGMLQELGQCSGGVNVGDGSLISGSGMDVWKGKQPLNGMLQEHGQCSRDVNVMINSEFYCGICMETLHIRELFPIDGCIHTFCGKCVSQYIAAKVKENVLSIGCPDPGCKDGALHPEACRDVIPPQLFQRWGAALCDSALGALKFYCPFKDCSALLIDDPAHGEAVITNVECPHCCRMFCAQCKVPWHDGVTCAEFQLLGEDERAREDLLLRKVAKESKWQRCPKCKIYVDRIEGCVFIICRCGHCFCYLCGSPMSRDSHRCNHCKRTW